MKLPWVQVLFRTLLILLLFTLGLTVDKDNFLNTIRPRRTGVFLAFCATLLSTAIVMPLLAVGVVKAFGLDAPSMLAVYVLIACPGGSFSNMAANILGANVALNAALTCACVLISLFMVPIACIYLLPIVLSGTDVAKPPSIKELSINGACVALPLLAGVLLSSRLKRASAIARKAVGVVGLSLIMVISFTQLSHFPPGRTVLAVEIIAALALMWGYTAGRMLRQPHDVCISMMIETAVHDTPLAQTLITSSYNLSKEELAEATLVVLLGLGFRVVAGDRASKEELAEATLVVLLGLGFRVVAGDRASKEELAEATLVVLFYDLSLVGTLT